MLFMQYMYMQYIYLSIFCQDLFDKYYITQYEM